MSEKRERKRTGACFQRVAIRDILFINFKSIVRVHFEMRNNNENRPISSYSYSGHCHFRTLNRASNASIYKY